jgi:predicted DNA-binding protein (UPF0251 family)
MVKNNNSILLESVLKALHNVVSRYTSNLIANETIRAAITTLKTKYDFLKYINVREANNILKNDFTFTFSSEINKISYEKIGKIIEALVRMVYNDIGKEIGLNFITDLKEKIDEQIIKKIKNFNIDFDQIQIEQQYAYHRQKQKKQIQKMASTGILNIKKPDNLIGYTWNNVSFWRHEPGKKYCTLYNKEGKIIDRLNLDQILKNHVEKLSEYIDLDQIQIKQDIKLNEKELKLLKMMLKHEMNTETAQHILNISHNELNNIIIKLSEMEMIHFLNYETIEITETGVEFLNKIEN